MANYVFSPLLPTSGHFSTNTSTSMYFLDHVDKFYSPGSSSTQQKETEGTYNVLYGTVVKGGYRKFKRGGGGGGGAVRGHTP